MGKKNYVQKFMLTRPPHWGAGLSACERLTPYEAEEGTPLPEMKQMRMRPVLAVAVAVAALAAVMGLQTSPACGGGTKDAKY